MYYGALQYSHPLYAAIKCRPESDHNTEVSLYIPVVTPMELKHVCVGSRGSEIATRAINRSSTLIGHYVLVLAGHLSPVGLLTLRLLLQVLHVALGDAAS